MNGWQDKKKNGNSSSLSRGHAYYAHHISANNKVNGHIEGTLQAHIPGPEALKLLEFVIFLVYP